MQSIKFILLFSICILCRITVISQGSRYYKLVGTSSLDECDIYGIVVENGRKDVPSGSKFEVVYELEKKIEKTNKEGNDKKETIVEVEKYFVIKFLDWRLNDEHRAQLNAYKTGYDIDSIDSDNLKKYLEYNKDIPKNRSRYFKVSKERFDKIATVVKSRTEPAIGTLTYPFKYRPYKQSDFQTDISITGNGGIRFNNRRFDDRSWGVMVGIGLASVELNDENTNGEIEEAQNYSAISLPITLFYEWQELQVGVSIGFDYLSRTNRNGWIHHGKPWISLGIGIDIFKESDVQNSDSVGNGGKDK